MNTKAIQITPDTTIRDITAHLNKIAEEKGNNKSDIHAIVIDSDGEFSISTMVYGSKPICVQAGVIKANPEHDQD
jgi:hypothetical protein